MRPITPLSLWAPVVAFMVAVHLLAGPIAVSPAFPVWDKLLHAVGYCAFGLLCLRAFHGGFAPPRTWPSLLALLLALGYAALDEWNQARVPGRHASVEDWAADALGAALAVPLLLLAFRRRGAAK